jgi:hypothetical protein
LADQTSVSDKRLKHCSTTELVADGILRETPKFGELIRSALNDVALCQNSTIIATKRYKKLILKTKDANLLLICFI